MMKFKQGDLILRSRPYAYVVCRDYRGRICDFCLTKNENLLRCCKCAFSYYCNKQCQKSAWKDHKPECANLIKFIWQLHETMLLMSRIIYKLKKNPTEFEEVLGTKRYFQDLISHSETIKNDAERMDTFNSISEMLKVFIPTDIFPSRNDLLEIYGKIAINGYGIFDEMQQLAEGLFLGPSVFDHSCQANAVMVFEGPVVFIKATEDISHSNISNIFVPYIDVLASTNERRDNLKTLYYFHCTCLRCEDEEKDLITNSILCPNEGCTYPTVIKKNVCVCIKCGEVKVDKQILSTAEQLTRKNKYQFQLLTKLQTEKKLDQLLIISNICIEESKKNFHLLNIHYVRILELAFDAASSLAKWETACDLIDDILIAYRYYYGDVHPNVGGLLLKQGKLQSFFLRLSKAEKTLKEAITILGIVYSKQHKLYVSCEDLLAKCQVMNLEKNLKSLQF